MLLGARPLPTFYSHFLFHWARKQSERPFPRSSTHTGPPASAPRHSPPLSEGKPSSCPPAVSCSGILLQQVSPLSPNHQFFSLCWNSSLMCCSSSYHKRKHKNNTPGPPAPSISHVSAPLRGTPRKEQLPCCLHFFISPSLTHPLQCWSPLWCP